MQAKPGDGRLASRSSRLFLKSKAAMRSVLMFSQPNICKWACSHAHRLPFLVVVHRAHEHTDGARQVHQALAQDLLLPLLDLAAVRTRGRPVQDEQARHLAGGKQCKPPGRPRRRTTRAATQKNRKGGHEPRRQPRQASLTSLRPASQAALAHAQVRVRTRARARMRAYTVTRGPLGQGQGAPWSCP